MPTSPESLRYTTLLVLVIQSPNPKNQLCSQVYHVQIFTVVTYPGKPAAFRPVDRGRLSR